MSRIQYLTSTNRRVDVLPTKISSGKSSYVSYIKKYALEKNVDGVPNVYRGNEPWELYWFTNNGYDAIAIQDYQITPNPDGTSTSAQRLNATTTNSVVKWLLNKYPPVAA
jgi:hypothetical protein